MDDKTNTKARKHKYVCTYSSVMQADTCANTLSMLRALGCTGIASSYEILENLWYMYLYRDWIPHLHTGC